MGRVRVVTIRIQEDELEVIDKFWQVRGFESRSEFIKTAIKEYIKRHSWRSSYPRSRRLGIVETKTIRAEVW